MSQSQNIDSSTLSDTMKPPVTAKVPKSNKTVSKSTYKCDACQSIYLLKWQMTRHIRSSHFNLLSRTPYCEMKKINQVWYEEVLNSNTYIEIKKTGHNTLVMKRIDPDATVNVTNTYRKTVDLRSIYPISSSSKMNKNHQCKVCLKFFTKRILQQHMEDVHCKQVKHSCGNCHKRFKKRSAYLKHKCYGGGGTEK